MELSTICNMTSLGLDHFVRGKHDQLGDTKDVMFVEALDHGGIDSGQWLRAASVCSNLRWSIAKSEPPKKTTSWPFAPRTLESQWLRYARRDHRYLVSLFRTSVLPPSTWVATLTLCNVCEKHSRWTQRGPQMRKAKINADMVKSANTCRDVQSKTAKHAPTTSCRV